MIETIYSLIFVGVGLYILRQGWKTHQSKQISLGPSEILGIKVLRYFRGDNEADKKEEEMKNKDAKKRAWGDIMFGILMLILGVFRLIIL